MKQFLIWLQRFQFRDEEH